MNIYFANDHAGYILKNTLIKYLENSPHHAINMGCDNADSVDYPDYAQKLCAKITQDADALGVLICGSGIGMSIMANRFKNIRAALAHNAQLAKLTREHNNANVLVLGAQFISPDEACLALDNFINTPFSQAPRHIARLAKLDSSLK